MIHACVFIHACVKDDKILGQSARDFDSFCRAYELHVLATHVGLSMSYAICQALHVDCSLCPQSAPIVHTQRELTPRKLSHVTPQSQFPFPRLTS